MGGGLMQLVAYGAQDIYLTGNPQITFFKVVYRRHTNFSMESISQTLNGSVGMGNSVSSTISRNGDLVHKLYLEATATCTNLGANPGSALINNVECEIGGQKIDKHYGHWMEVWAQLTQPNDSGIAAVFNNNGAGSGVAVGSGAATLFQRTTGMGGVSGVAAATSTLKLYIPLQFWFCRNPGLALPLIALQYHEVKIKIEFATALGTGSSGLAAELFADYIYLDTDERRRFAQVSHEYLIEQVQYESFGTSAVTMDLNFNHPVKELIWTGGTDGSANGTSADRSTSTPKVVGTGNYHLKLNGHDRMSPREFSYFTRVQVLDHHTGFGSVHTADSIAVYSFALKPEEHQPSGTCNFSRIDNAQLIASVAAAGGCNVYAVNYNVLRIMSGMGGLAYSN